ncbi:MAG: hypothetical protein KDA28_14170, partial [Phycisphaerales bacterium]|nr:hypothetical protein [Phycisphaerales bacterium]
SFFKINEHQQLHLSEWKDTPSFRGHVALQIDDWESAFKRFKELGIIDTSPWGKVRQLPDGTYQMFVRDPAGNLVEISGAPGSKVDPAIFEDTELCDQGASIYVSNRNDDRGLKSDDASLYHGKK